MKPDPLGPHGARVRSLLAAGARLGEPECRAIDRFWQQLANAERMNFLTTRNQTWDTNRAGGLRRGRLLAADRLVNGLHTDFAWRDTHCAQLLEGAIMAELELGLSAPAQAILGKLWRQACTATGQPASLD